jgi:hypothetical protein
VGLFLRPIEPKLQGKLIPITPELRLNDFSPGARILGEDGNLLGFYVNEIGAWHLGTRKLITVDDPRRANSSLGDVWADAKYELDERLIVTTSDYQRAFEVDAGTLQAVPVKSARARRLR